MRYRLFVLAGLLAACDNAGESFSQGVEATGTVDAQAYFDRDGSLAPTPGNIDTVFAGVRINLVPPGGHVPVATALTDANGLVTFTGVSAGRYSIIVDTASLGDSLTFTGASPTEVTVFPGGLGSITGSFGFPPSSVSDVRGASVGDRVFITGVILAGFQTFGDTTAYLVDVTGSIRLTRAFFNAPLPGDSVRVTGTVARRTGQVVVDSAKIYIYFLSPPAPQPVPTALSTGTARNAAGGTLDAALVSITGATIIDTATVGTDFVIQVNDGSGMLDVVFDANVSPPVAQPAPGQTLVGDGVLVPINATTWQLKPRATGDVTIN